MTGPERRLHELLTAEAGRVQPAADLFARVQGGVQDDRRRRRRRAQASAGGVLMVVAAAGGAVLGGWRPQLDPWIAEGRGGHGMSWWVLELATTLVLVGLALWLGPFIKRFGRAYAADVFHDNPLTGKSYLLLTDIVYYLIFVAYILFTVRFEPPLGWRVTVSAAQLQYECARIGGILLVLGTLHGVNLVLMPVLGRLFSLNRRLRPATQLAPSQRERIEQPPD